MRAGMRSMKQTNTLVEAAVFCVLICAPCLAQERPEQERFEEVRMKLVQESANLTAQGYKREALEIVIPVTRGGGAGFQLELVAGATYATVAACDDRCEHVELSIDDPSGTRLAMSAEKAGVVI